MFLPRGLHVSKFPDGHACCVRICRKSTRLNHVPTHGNDIRQQPSVVAGPHEKGVPVLELNGLDPCVRLDCITSRFR